MALNEREWDSIYAAIRSTNPQNEVVYGRVVKRNVAKKVIYLSEFGDQPIPLVALNAVAHVYDETPTGVKKKTVKIEFEVPKVGELVVVLRQMGERRLPKCVGVVQTHPRYFQGG